MTGLVILGNGFEVSEALVPCDLYFRAGIKTVKASVYNNKEVISQAFAMLNTLLFKIENISIQDNFGIAHLQNFNQR